MTQNQTDKPTEATDASLLARLQERKDYASKDYASDTSLGYYWRQCRWCKGYAEAPVGTEVWSHAIDCPVPDLEAAADALRRSGEALRRLQEDIEQLSSIQVGSPDPTYFEATPLIRRQDVLAILSRQSGAVKTER